MRTVRSVAELRSALSGPRRRGASIALVPTMGAFHDGHLALMRHARETCDVVVVSLFVNPTQFDEAADLAAYPRDEQRDAALAAGCGVDVLFAPGPEEVYPDGFATSVRVRGLGERLEGEYRPGHFEGVATVVVKLLNMARPDVAVFGQKDAQQAALVRRVVRDLDIPVRIDVQPTLREPDGLAMSSRNARLTADQRAAALGLPRGLRAAAGSGERDPGRLSAIARAEMDGLHVEYVAVVDPDTFLPLSAVDGRALIAAAVRAGSTRLIDNVELS